MNTKEQTYIKIPYPNAGDLHLKINAKVCALVISTGIGNVWVTGKYNDPKNTEPLNVYQKGNVASIVVGDAFSYRVPPSYIPKLSLSLGTRKPFSLTITAGDVDNHFDFGCIPLSSLEIRCGASHQAIQFSYPNPQPMSQMKIAADASSIEIKDIANANAAEFRMDGDFSKCHLDFGGELKRNTSVHLAMGTSKIEVVVPTCTATKIISAHQPAIYKSTDFLYQDGAYWNSPARDHPDPLLSIYDAASIGSFHLKSV